jgi:hypothetical protein
MIEEWPELSWRFALIEWVLAIYEIWKGYGELPSPFIMSVEST